MSGYFGDDEYWKKLEEIPDDEDDVLVITPKEPLVKRVTKKERLKQETQERKIARDPSIHPHFTEEEYQKRLRVLTEDEELLKIQENKRLAEEKLQKEIQELEKEFTVESHDELLAEAIRFIRKKKKLKLAALEAETGIALSTIFRMEQGTRPIKSNHLIAICNALGVPPSTIWIYAETSLCRKRLLMHKKELKYAKEYREKAKIKHAEKLAAIKAKLGKV